MMRHWIGVDLGGTKILAGLYDDQMQLLSRAKLATDAEQGGEAVFARIVQCVDTLISDAKIERSSVAGMGLAVPGQIVPGQSIIRYAPNLNWRDYDLSKLYPADWSWPLFLENDVRMGTYGEWTHGAAKGTRHVFGIFCGTGVGGGLILNNQLYNGFNGHAGEIGHIVINWRKSSSLESIAGRKSMARRAGEVLQEASRKVRKDWKEIDLGAMKSSSFAKLSQRNDPVALQLIDDAARAIGCAVGSVINLLSPEMVVVGGGVAQALGEPFLERIWEIAIKVSLPRAAENVRCVPAMLGDDAGIVGGAAFARSKVLPAGELR